MASGAVRMAGAFVEILGDDKQFRRVLASSERRLKAWSANVAAAGRAALALSAGILAPLALTVRAASDLQETMGKFDTVFGGNAAAMKAWGDEFAAQVGRSQAQVAGFMAGSQDLFVPLGFEAGAAEELSKQVTALAVDLASFNNMADDDALRDLHAALTGSGEVMKKYGVIVSEAAVKQELLNNGMDPAIATNMEKVQARLNIIMAGTVSAQGDAIRTGGSFANQMKRLKGIMADTSATVGTALLPPLTLLVEQFADGAKVAGKWIGDNEGLVVSIAKVGATIGGVGVALYALAVPLKLTAMGIGVLTFGVNALSFSTGILTGVVGFLLTPIGLAAAIFGGLLVTAGYLSGAFDTLGDTFGDIGKTFGRTWGGIQDALRSGNLEAAGEIAFAGLELAWQELLHGMKAAWSDFWEWVKPTDTIAKLMDAMGMAGDGPYTILGELNSMRQGPQESAALRNARRDLERLLAVNHSLGSSEPRTDPMRVTEMDRDMLRAIVNHSDDRQEQVDIEAAIAALDAQTERLTAERDGALNAAGRATNNLDRQLGFNAVDSHGNQGVNAILNAMSPHRRREMELAERADRRLQNIDRSLRDIENQRTILQVRRA